MTDLRRAATVGTALVAALGLAVPLVQHWEGLVLVPHKDIGGTHDVCFGDTKAERRAYTPDECATLLIARLASDYAPPVIQCVPGLADRPKQLAAALVFSYNLGAPTFCGSTAARLMNADDWADGCDALVRFNGVVTAKPIPGALSSRHITSGPHKGMFFNILRGLDNRRKAERELCRSGL